ncbi:hypothetical protein [Roseivirga misakiensis]|uniref:PE-PGRS family protein n=1 Tax=Roseivirga misakiensis TaxID=1563681 RepID=A0A1E5T813_9BACT|nr:hypothetical protein [Roseivirga misakiensis]OEK07513.1 hypothetical protein BFP71_00270 [Roseivirga misakiensis]
MKRILTALVVLSLCANGCKESGPDTNPQSDDQEVSDLFSDRQSLGEIQISDLDEASGLAHSRSNSNYLWSHNDSGGNPQLFLMDEAGADIGRFTIDGAQNLDWEDLAIGPGPTPGTDYLYVGDIGDNRAVRPDRTIYRVPEPDLNTGSIPASSTLSGAETINYVYEDGPRDAEALMVDPSNNDLYIVSKREASVILYVLPFPQNVAQMDTAERVTVLPFTQITAGDISFDGNEVVLKNYLNIYHWSKTGSESIRELLSTTPERLNYTVEPQGEAIAWHTNGNQFYTISELANNQPVVLYRYTRN